MHFQYCWFKYCFHVSAKGFTHPRMLEFTTRICLHRFFVNFGILLSFERLTVRFHSHVPISIALLWPVWVIVVLQLKEIASFPRFQFSFGSKFRCSFCVFVLSFCFSLLKKKKKEWYISYFLVPTLHLNSLKKKKKSFILLPLRFVISSICFFQKYFWSQLSWGIVVLQLKEIASFPHFQFSFES